MDLSPLDDEPNIYGSLDPYELIDLAEINMKDKKHWSHKDRRRRKEIMVKMFENCLRPTNRLKEK
jgi:hypothetical protein